MQNMKEQIEVLERLGASHRNTSAPNTVEEAIRRGMTRAKAEGRRARRAKTWLRLSASAAAVFLFFIILSIRVSPDFASAVSRLPGMEKIVELIAYDRGLVAAVDHDYYQPIGVSDTHDGLTLTIDGVIRDEGRIVLFYTITDQDGVTGARLAKPEFRLPDGSYLEGGLSYSSVYPNVEAAPAGMYSSQMDVWISGEELPDQFTLEAKLETGNIMLSPTWEIPMQLRPFSKEDLRTYPLDRTVTIEGQKIHFRNVTVYPTRIAVEVEFDEANSKEVFSFIDLTLIGDNGERFISNGSNGFGNRQTIYFVGSSFTIPNSFRITGSMARAVDKNKMELVLDTERNEILQAPDEKVKIGYVEKGNSIDEWLTITLVLSGILAEDNMHYGLIVSEFNDASGETYQMREFRQTSTGGISGEQQITFYIPDQTYEQPLTFHIDNYPEYIYEPFEIWVR